MLIDAFTYNDEADMLSFRLKMLSPFVDKFVIVESDHTFSGRPKPYTLIDWVGNDTRIKYIPFRAKVEGLKLDSPPSNYDPKHDCWSIEKQQRNAITEACLEFSDNDMVMIGDVDEIPSRMFMAYALEEKIDFLGSRQNFFYYNLNNLRAEEWTGTVACKVSRLLQSGAQHIRDIRGMITPVLMHAGWHLSYFMTPEKIKDKIESFSHQELNKDCFKNEEHVKSCIATGADLFARQTQSRRVDKHFFPEYFVKLAPDHWWAEGERQ